MDEFAENIETWTVVVDADTSSLRKELTAASNIGKQFSRSLISAFEGIAVKGKNLGEVLRGLALDLSKMVLKAAFKPLEQGLGNLFSGLFSGGLGLGGGAATPLPVPFAQGGVIASPTTFPLGAGVGLAGERGAEAILPLSRGPDGRLGVAAQSGGGRNVNVTFNVATPDAASFQRSQTQVAAMLSRAVSLGGRNM
ncbi:MAG: phage tail tape measure protein [Alphaproteobacteria bacterium]|nr:phage tail tape measure protein [Alphaproteobacteria bacterium]